ncbi:hypothetical protein PGANDO_0972, partial [Porphyromonas gingivalis]
MDDPMRSPVYDPGPELRATIEGFAPKPVASVKTSCTNTPMLAACELPTWLTRCEIIVPAAATATEQPRVEVSM